MSESTPALSAPAAEGQPLPPLTVNVQYVKDLSFEVPSGPEIFASLRSAPQVQINLDVQARRLQEGQNVFEVVLSVRAEATEPPSNGTAGRPVFIAELAYAGIFTIANVPDDTVEPMLLIECPRLLFPFARSIISDVTREGGFPAVLLQPIDFIALWQQRRQQQAASSAVN